MDNNNQFYQQPPQWQQPFPPQPQPQPYKPKGTAALVLGIIGILTSFIFVGGILGIIAIVLGATGSSANKRYGYKGGTATAGLVLGSIATALMVITIIIAVSGSNNSSSKTDLSKDDFAATCSELNYKDVKRNPDKYKGQNFYIDVQIFDVSTSFGTTTYKVFTKDPEYDIYDGDMFFVTDKRDKSAKDYEKLLEEDIIRIYGTFDRLVDTTNFIDGSSGQEINLDMFYVDILQK